MNAERLALLRPSHLDDDVWDSIAVHRDRVIRALDAEDRPAAVGFAKELVECIARVVLDATGGTLGDEARFPAVVDAAQRQLGLRPADLSTDPALRSIAQSALRMVKALNEFRNDVGTGHGRARLPVITEAATSACLDAALLWSHWSLRVLEPLLASSARVFIDRLHTAISRRDLATAMSDVDLTNQPSEAQLQIGVAVGQRAGGGFGNAYAIGVNPAIANGGLAEWPTAYRLGLVEGFVLDWSGQLALNPYSAEATVDVLAPIPPALVDAALTDLTEKVRSATWAPERRDRVDETRAVITAMDEHASRLPDQSAAAIATLGEALAMRLSGL